MSKDKIRQELRDLRHRLEVLEGLSGLSSGAMRKPDCCGAGVGRRDQRISEQGVLITGRAVFSGRARSSIDASRDDNGFLGCMYSAYNASVNNDVFSHGTTADAFSNLRGGSSDGCIIVGHGDEGLIVTGTGQTVDGTDKYMAEGNESSWSPYAGMGIPAPTLCLFGCHVGGGTAGANFLHRVARAVRKNVGAWTGLVWCSGNNVWADGEFVTATPSLRPEPVESPVMYEARRDMSTLKLRSAEGHEDVALSAVQSVNFTPVGTVPQKFKAITAAVDDATKILQEIDFASPFVTEDKPGAILVGLLTITFESKTKERHIRSFRVLSYSLLQDACFPTTYYYASNRLRSVLTGSK